MSPFHPRSRFGEATNDHALATQRTMFCAAKILSRHIRVGLGGVKTLGGRARSSRSRDASRFAVLAMFASQPIAAGSRGCDAGEIVGQDVQRHLGGYLWETLHQEVRRPHPHLQSAKGCSTVSLRSRMAWGFLSRRLCTASSACSCSQRVIRRSLPVVQRGLSAQSRHALVQ